MNINRSTHCSWPHNPAKNLKLSDSHACNSRSGHVETPSVGQNGQSQIWDTLMAEMVVNVMSYLPINEVIKCYTLDKRTCQIITESILKRKMRKIGAPFSKGIYSKEYYKHELRPWLISLGQNSLTHHLDIAIRGDNFHQLLCLFISEIFKSPRKIAFLKQPEPKDYHQIRFNCEGSIAFIEHSSGGVSILACHRSHLWSEILYVDYKIRSVHGDAVFTADGTRLALCDENGALMILSFGRDESGMLKIRQKNCLHYENRIRRLQFSPDGLDLLFNLDESSWWYRKRFVILSLNSQGQWLETKALNFPAPASYPPQFSPDGSCFVIYSLQDGTFKFFNNSQPRQVASLCSYRGVLDRLYNAVSSPRCRWVQQVSDPKLRGICPLFSPDGISMEFLIRPSFQIGMAKQVEGCWVKQPNFDERFTSLSYSPDGQTMAGIFRNKHRYDALCIFARNSAGNWAESHRYFYDMPAVDEARTGLSIVSSGFTGDSESLWIHHRPSILDIRQKIEGEWQLVYRTERLANIEYFRDSSDGRTLAISDKSGNFSVLFNNGRLWEEHLRIEAKDLHFCFSRDNQWMAVVTGAGYARLLALQNQRWCFRTDWFLACREGKNSVKFCPNNVAIVIEHRRNFSSAFGYTRQSAHIFNLIPGMT